MKIKTTITGLAFCLIVSNSALGQFAGDVFFTEPAIEVVSGEASTLEVSIFSGDKAFGAAQLQVAYDPLMLEIVDISGEGIEFENELFWSSGESGTFRLISVNAESDLAPFGTVAFANITIKAIGVPGILTELAIDITETIDTFGSGYPSSDGFSGQVLITTPGSIATARNTVGRRDNSVITVSEGPIFDQVTSMRPVGQIVELYIPTPLGLYELQTVQAVDPSTQSE